MTPFTWLFYLIFVLIMWSRLLITLLLVHYTYNFLSDYMGDSSLLKVFLSLYYSYLTALIFLILYISLWKLVLSENLNSALLCFFRAFGSLYGLFLDSKNWLTLAYLSKTPPRTYFLVKSDVLISTKKLSL